MNAPISLHNLLPATGLQQGTDVIHESAHLHVTGGATFRLPQLFVTVQPVPKLDFCFPTIGLISGGARVTCYFLNIPFLDRFSAVNVSSRFDSITGSVFSAAGFGSVFSAGVTAPAAVFEGNSTITVTIGTSVFSYFPFLYVRPCNFETFCASRGFIPFDSKILQEPAQDDVCSESYCLDPKVLPIPSIDLVSPSVVSTVGGTSVADAAGVAAVAFVVRLPLGIALGWLWMRRRSLLAAIALHSAYNLAIVVTIALS